MFIRTPVRRFWAYGAIEGSSGVRVRPYAHSQSGKIESYAHYQQSHVGQRLDLS